MELEQFYASRYSQSDKKVSCIKKMLGHYLEAYLESFQSLRLLNSQITEIQREEVVERSRYRKVFWAVVFTIRVRKRSKLGYSPYSPPFFRELVIDMPILKSIQ